MVAVKVTTATPTARVGVHGGVVGALVGAVGADRHDADLDVLGLPAMGGTPDTQSSSTPPPGNFSTSGPLFGCGPCPSA